MRQIKGKHVQGDPRENIQAGYGMEGEVHFQGRAGGPYKDGGSSHFHILYEFF